MGKKNAPEPSGPRAGEGNMCCRYWMEESPELRPFVEQVNRAPLKEKMVSKLARPIKTSGEIRPTDMVPVVAPDKHGEPVVFPMVWGFSNPKAGGPIVNARVETAATKPLWKEAWGKHRCVIPASWYYEWEHLVAPDGRTKTGPKYMIQPKGCKVTYLAGLYRIEEYADLNSVISTYCSEMYIKFITGEVDIDTQWDEYIATLQKMNVERMIAIKQAQLDRFNAR